MKKLFCFIWDDVAEKEFDALNKVLNHTPLLHPPNYRQDYLLYLATSDDKITVVFVQEDDSYNENVIYYLIMNLTITRMKYMHVEKLAFEAMQVV